MLNTSEIKTKINSIINDCTGADLSNITPHANIKDDLNADSMDRIEITIECERAYGIHILDQEAENINTVDQLHKTVIKKILQKGTLVEVL